MKFKLVEIVSQIGFTNLPKPKRFTIHPPFGLHVKCVSFLHLLLQVSLLSYTMSFGNIYRIVNGYDNCGNICGRLNTFELSHFECSGANMTEKPFLYVESSGIVITDSGQINRICVENCSIYSG